MSDPLTPDDVALKFKLPEEMRTSGFWAQLSLMIQARLDVMRRRNDQPLTPSETDTLRGHIACLKSFIALGKEPPNDGQDERRPLQPARRSKE